MANIAGIMELYTAYFNRAADKDGVDYWADMMDTNSWTLDDVASSFADQTEYTDLYSGLTNAEIVAQVYTNVLNRTADTDGAAYWETQLTDGAVSVSQLIQAVVNAATEMDEEGNYVNADDAALVNNKTAVSQYYYDLGLNETAVSLAGISDDASVTAAKAAADQAATGGQTFTLTSGNDTITGTDGIDTIDAVVSALSSAKTLNAEDVIDGGAGEDTINVTLDSNFAGFTADKGSMTNVETANLTNNTTIARTFDASGVTGVTQYNVDATKAAVTMNNVIEAVNVSLTAEGTQTFTMNFKDVANTTDDVIGNTTDDALTLSLDSVGTVEDKTTDAVERKVVTATINNIEEITLDVTGENVAALGSDAAKSLTITGTGSLELDDIGASTTSVDGSATTGNMIIDTKAAGGTALKSISTGSGDDEVTVTSGDLLANATVALGDGNDTLVWENGGATTQLSMTGVETIELSTSGGNNDTISMKNVSGVTKILANDNFTDDATFVNMGSQDLAIEINGANAGTVATADDEITVDNAGTVTVDLTALDATLEKGATNTAADDQGTDVIASAATDLVVNVGSYVDSDSDITAAKAASVTLNVASGKDDSDTPVELTEFSGLITADTATSVNVNAEGTFNGTVTAEKATSVVVSANGSVNGSTINAAKATSVELTLNNTAAQTVTLGTEAAETLSITSVGALTLHADTDIDAVQNLSVNTDETFTVAATEDFLAAAVVEFAGTDADSEVAFAGDLGDGTTNDYSMNITASGLKSGLDLGGAIKGSDGADLVVDATAVTGAITIDGGITGFTNTTINTSGAGDDVTLGAINARDVANNTVSITSSNTGDFAVGAIGGTVATADVTIALDGVSGTVGLDVIKGDDVSIDVSAALGAVTYNDDITVTGDLTIDGSALFANQIDGTDGQITLAGATQVITLNGGIKDDDYLIDAFDDNDSVTIKGDLDIGTNSFAIDFDTATIGQDYTLDMTGFANYDASTITLSSEAFASTVKLNGADTAVDTIVVTAAESTTITGFNTTEDKLDVQAVATAGAIALAADAAATTVTDGAAYVWANGADGTSTEVIADYTDKADVAAFIAAAFSDEATGDDFVAVINDLVADKSYIYAVVFDDGNAGVGAIDADAITLMGTVTETDGKALVAGDIVS